MKEQIRKLVDQVRKIEYDDDNSQNTPILVGHDLEKFADLIIRRCAEICREDHWRYLNATVDREDRFFRGVKSGKKSAAIECHRNILKEFDLK